MANKTDEEIDARLKKIQDSLRIENGDFNDELPEQRMVARYLTGNEKILEIGGNIGRNTLVMAYILNNHNNDQLLTLESNEIICNQLYYNRHLNGLNFRIENAALSKRPLIQKCWDTMVSDVLLDGYDPVKTITYEQIKQKYPIDFDTLVLDCEGAFYYIVHDMPEILDNIKLIIMENDYHDITQKEYLDQVLRERQFRRDYVEKGVEAAYLLNFPCADYFYEVWVRS